ncbi:2-phospho-L-lactate guanylyltransferase [Thalassiella azotivora]
MVLPVKGGPAAKSRLGWPHLAPGLALAMAGDCLDAVLATPGVRRAVVVTGDAAAADLARGLGADVVDEPVDEPVDLADGGTASRPADTVETVRTAGTAGTAGTAAGGDTSLRRAVAAGVDRCTGPTAVLLADLPCLRPQDLGAALHAVDVAFAGGAASVVVPDADGVGTVLLAGRSPADVVPRFGGASAAAHRADGAVVLAPDLPGLRRDVDTLAALAQAVALGLGPRTAATLPSVQTTVLGFDPETGTGTVVTDDGVELELAPGALEGSGLRHLRPGQRVTCVQVPGTPPRVSGLRILGVSA